MTARSAHAARHRRIPQRPKVQTTYRPPVPAEIIVAAWLTTLLTG